MGSKPFTDSFPLGSPDERNLMTAELHDDVRSDRAATLYADDPEFRAAEPSQAVADAARLPGLRSPGGLAALMEGYADRPEVGRRSTSVAHDPATGRAEQRLLPAFETVTYGEVWSNVKAIAAAWSGDEVPVRSGEFVATIGFASADYLTVDLAACYLALVAVPLQH